MIIYLKWPQIIKKKNTINYKLSLTVLDMDPKIKKKFEFKIHILY